MTYSLQGETLTAPARTYQPLGVKTQESWSPSSAAAFKSGGSDTSPSQSFHFNSQRVLEPRKGFTVYCSAFPGLRDVQLWQQPQHSFYSNNDH